MKGIFDIIEGEIIFSAETLAIPFIKEIWQKDSDINKVNAKKEIEFIVFFSDINSPYQEYDIKERVKILNKQIFKNDDIEIPPYLLEAITAYAELQYTAKDKLLVAAKNGVFKLSSYFNESNVLHEDYVGNLQKVGKVVESLEILEEKAKKERINNTQKIKGKAELKPREIPKRRNS